jgi:hypothetical protein
MTLPQEAGKVASSAIEALKGSPGLLAVILLQLATLGVLYVASQRAQERAHGREMAMIERCYPLDSMRRPLGYIPGPAGP